MKIILKQKSLTLKSWFDKANVKPGAVSEAIHRFFLHYESSASKTVELTAKWSRTIALGLLVPIVTLNRGNLLCHFELLFEGNSNSHYCVINQDTAFEVEIKSPDSKFDGDESLHLFEAVCFWRHFLRHPGPLLDQNHVTLVMQNLKAK